MTIRIVASFFVKNLNAASDAALEMAGYETVTSQEHFDDFSPAVHMEAFVDIAGDAASGEDISEVMDEVAGIVAPLGGDCWMVDQWVPHLHKPFHHQ
jgi:hypothetical protein